MKYFIIFLLIIATANIEAQNNPYEIREAIASSIENLNIQPEKVYKILNKEISGGDFSIPVRIYYPSNENSLPIIYHVHGGAWIAGNLDTHDNICRRLALETNSIVIAIDYRRPPEYQYPFALEDCLFILKWIDINKKVLNGDGRLFLLGDSAGGGLISSLCFKNLSLDEPVRIDGQILINPATDLREESDSYKRYKPFIDWYVPKELDKNQKWISPLVSNEFKELPKSIILVSEKDRIKNDGILYHQKMLESGNSSVIFEFKEIGHLAGLWAGNSEKADLAVKFVVSEIRKWISE